MLLLNRDAGTTGTFIMPKAAAGFLQSAATFILEEDMRGKRILIFLTGFLMLFTFGCSSYQEAEQLRVETSLFAMNTYMTFTAYGENSEAALESVKQKIKELESLWSVTDEDSEIYQANYSSGQFVQMSADTAALVSFALEMARKTEGALEPTLYPVLRAWGFTTEQKQVPSQEELDRLLSLVDYSQISLQGNRLTVPDGMELDLGAVGKGYAADLATEVLREQGIESALLSLGGNIQAVGSRPDGTDWRIGIRAPWEKENLGVFQVRDAAVVTSGGYENYFEDTQGNIYWHIIDPSTGFPAHSGLQSVTIIGTDGKTCDALSTALFVMGPEKAEKYWRKNSDFDMLLVTEDNEVILTEGIADSFVLSDGRDETVRVLKR